MTDYSFGPLLRERRTRAGLSQAALARAVGVNSGYISRLEAGERAAPSQELVLAIGGGTTLPSASAWLGLMGCAGAGKVYRFAQIVAAATLALEISASAAMATAGSENFYKAHFERGGLR